MTFADLVAMVPPEKHHYALEFVVDYGPLPTGEEGARNWITGSSFSGLEINDERQWVEIEVFHG